MKQILPIAALTCLMTGSLSFAGGHDPKIIIPLLKQTKVSLVEAIDLAEKTSGPATSAKYEVNDEGKLELSVYTIPEGLNVEPEKATLTELSGNPNTTPFQPKAEIFTDKEHIARASVHMTLAQLSQQNLKQIIQASLKKVPGTPFDVRNPMMKNRRPVVEVLIATSSGEAKIVRTDLISQKQEVETVK